MPQLRFTAKSIPLFFVSLTIITYGLLVSWVGYYWDDWVFVYLAHFFGSSELIRAFAGCRPFLGPIFYITTVLFGDAPIMWQVFGLAIRFFMVYTFWWSLSTIWPKHKRQVLMTALLFLVYPGYSQQWVALTHINQEWIPLIAYIFSIGITAYALRNPVKNTRATILSLILMFVGLFTTEYFIGFEFIRFLVVCYLSQGSTILERIRYSIRRWMPYFVLWLADGIWLFYYYTSGLYQSYGISFFDKFNNGLLQIFLDLILEPIKTLKIVGFTSWVQTLNLFNLPLQGISFWLAAGLLLLGFILVSLFLLNMDYQEAEQGSDSWAFQAIALGIVGILAGRIPSWVAGLPVSVRFEFDRFLIAMMFGASLLLMGLIELLIKNGKRKVYIVSLIVALGVGWQFLNADSYRRDWAHQKQFFYELSWRVPAIKPGTILLTHQITSIPFESDMALTAPLNWIYAPSLSNLQIPFAFMFTKIRLQSKLPNLEPDQAIAFDYRTAKFQGSTSDSIVFYYPEDGCLKVIGSNDPDESILTKLPVDLKDAVRLSNPTRIETNAESPVIPGTIFGKELEKSWCYYYQKAELARQNQNWAQISKLSQESLSKGYSPENPIEWIPFIEGNINTGNYELANKLLDNTTKNFPKTRPSICEFLKRLQSQSKDQSNIGFASENIKKHECTP